MVHYVDIARGYGHAKGNDAFAIESIGTVADFGDQPSGGTVPGRSSVLKQAKGQLISSGLTCSDEWR